MTLSLPCALLDFKMPSYLQSYHLPIIFSYCNLPYMVEFVN